MAQGSIKQKAPKAAPPKRKSGGISKPKPAKKSKADKLQRKYTAGLTARTERMLGERVGHMELIGKGRKKDDKAGGRKTRITTVGGSKKFG